MFMVKEIGNLINVSQIHKLWTGVFYENNFCKKNELKLTFIKIVNPIIQILLWESLTDTCPLTLLTVIAVTLPLKNISNKLKSIFLLRDFHANILKCNDHNSTNQFSFSLVPV